MVPTIADGEDRFVDEHFKFVTVINLPEAIIMQGPPVFFILIFSI